MKVTVILATLLGLAAAVPATQSFEVDLSELEERSDLEARGKCASLYSCVSGRCIRIVCNSTGIGTTCTTFKGGKC
ncbi:uncharacterized protein E0L32_006770 [Thyridium curvatum]|uniref:Uncharacterized protein n=1 Tax=Thyridium curvatum TaxID=1093900 RepID=A0A507B8D0_9PEZI|nr:uncharacterized protein E0L32_006770 [Thyridium curvatum]TPX12890.1 hypothetical protein E0L32_006770 [Thyridium curvatum]